MNDHPPVQLVYKGDLYKIFPDRVEVYPSKTSMLPTVYDWSELDSELRTRVENRLAQKEESYEGPEVDEPEFEI